jgi:DNA invertase Pin-like site-specific DNA recombinase
VESIHAVTDTHQPTRAVGYVRVSQVGARSGDSFLSPDLQRDRIKAWANYRGAELVKWYTDLDISGRTGVYRPELERMMVDAQSHLFDVVAVYRLTRFGRSVKDTADRYSQLRDLGIGLVSVTEDIDTTTASGKFMQNMLFAMAEFESERIGEEWKGVHRNRRARGLHHATRGVYGYQCEGAVPVTVEVAEAVAVRGAYQRRAAGQSIPAVREWLHAEGHRPRSGGEWFSLSSLRVLLSNPAYAGLVHSDDDLIAASHPAIITRDVWDTVQAMGGTARPPRHTAGLLAGLVRCASCGGRMAASYSRGVRLYRCHDARSTRCPQPTAIRADRLDEYAERHLLTALSGKRGRVGGNPERHRREVERLQARSRDLQRALDRLADERYILGSLDETEYARQTQRLLEERAAVDEQARIAAAAPQAPKVEVLGRDAWERAPMSARQRIARAAIDRVVITPPVKGRERWTSVDERAEIRWL